MGCGLSMGARGEITKKYTREYACASKKAKGRLLDELVGVTGWSRDNARRAIRNASRRRGPARAVRGKPRGRGYSYDALKVLIEVWTLIGEPCGKYLAAVMEDTVERLVRFGELKTSGDRLTPEVRGELMVMSPATIDRYLAPTKAARYPGAKSATRPGATLRGELAVRRAMDDMEARPGFLPDRPGRPLRALPQRASTPGR
jgi:hypothetical protein